MCEDECISGSAAVLLGAFSMNCNIQNKARGDRRLMSSRMKAKVTPNLMRWAREQAGLSISEAAEKIKRSLEDIVAWEDGEDQPSIAQARKAAEVYKRPFAVLYLDDPPEDFVTLQDFRRLPETVPKKFSPELSYLIRISRHRQEWARDYLLSEGYEGLPFVGSSSIKEPPESISLDIRKSLNLTPKMQINSPTRYHALRLWMDSAERAGVFIFRQRKVPLAEARGFAISDDIAPFIFLNSNDSKSGQLFTLVHELAHLWLGISAISNMEYRGRYVDEDARNIEITCNKIATNAILDDRLFIEEWGRRDSLTSVEESIEYIAAHFCVSEEVVARRLLDKKIIGREHYLSLRDDYTKRWMEFKERERLKMKNSEGGPSYYVTSAASIGYAFTQIVVSGYLSGSISGRDASSVLNVKVNNLRQLGEVVGIRAFKQEVSGD